MKQILSSQLHPTAKSDVVITEPSSGETIVYDLKTDRAHCLNSTASFVWNQCDGQTSVSEIAQRFSQKQGNAVDESVIWLALKQLDHAQLLREPLEKELFVNVNRRATLKKLGIAAAITLPTIVSLLAPTVYAGISCVPGAPCNTPSQCGGRSCSGSPSTPGICLC